MIDGLDENVRVEFAHRVHFARDVLDPASEVLAACVAGTDAVAGAGNVAGGVAGNVAGGPGRVLAFVDAGLVRAGAGLPERVVQYARAHASRMTLAGPVQRVPGGEACKNEPAELRRVLEAIHAAGLDRHSHVLAIGGGAVLDCVGFAAAIAHRGIRLIRMPSTTLAQCDAGVGVKSGVNAFGKKNYLGAFAVPAAVINDEQLLTTLSPRDWRSGFSEAVKVALLKDPALLARIERDAAAIDGRDMRRARPVLRRAAELHVEHVADGGDPFELGSARPLDFGHWAAHKLEQMSGYALRHGEAVAIGLALDVSYAELVGLMPARTAHRVRQCLTQLGFALFHERMAPTGALLRGLEEFREHLGGRLTIPMLRDVGQPVDVHEIDADVMEQAVRLLAAQAAGVAGIVGARAGERS
ncbi:MAG: 3-dehydroquinate synthase [Phycisphaeraceae bacterium]